jgi:hypothetical protein
MHQYAEKNIMRADESEELKGKTRCGIARVNTPPKRTCKCTPKTPSDSLVSLSNKIDVVVDVDIDARNVF